MPHNICIYISNIPLCSSLHLIYNVRIFSVFCVFNLIYLYAVLLLILFCFVSYRHCHQSEKLWTAFIELKTNEKRDKHFNIPESAFFVYFNIFVSAISLVEIRDLQTRTLNILFVWKCHKCVFFFFVCFPCTATFSVYFHSNIFIGAVKY